MAYGGGFGATLKTVDRTAYRFQMDTAKYMLRFAVHAEWLKEVKTAMAAADEFRRHTGYIWEVVNVPACQDRSVDAAAWSPRADGA